MTVEAVSPPPRPACQACGALDGHHRLCWMAPMPVLDPAAIVKVPVVSWAG